MQIQKENTELGQIEYAFRTGEPLIVLLNCFGSFDTIQNFSQVLKYLPKDLEIFAPDFLNTGYSGKSIKSYSITDEAKIINKLNAKNVIILAHSIGGVYAFQVRDKVKNLKAFVGIEPTDREIILNPPQEKAYLKRNKNETISEKFIHQKIFDLFSETEAKTFWQTIEKNEAHFNDQDDQHLMNAMKKDVFWFNQDKWNDSIPTIIITEKYRMSEYERSEYFNQNSESKIIPMGTFHYIQWEYPHEIADIL